MPNATFTTEKKKNNSQSLLHFVIIHISLSIDVFIDISICAASVASAFIEGSFCFLSGGVIPICSCRTLFGL